MLGLAGAAASRRSRGTGRARDTEEADLEQWRQPKEGRAQGLTRRAVLFHNELQRKVLQRKVPSPHCLE